MAGLISIRGEGSSVGYCGFITHFLSESPWNLILIDRELPKLFKELSEEDQNAFRNGCRLAIDLAIKTDNFRGEKNTPFFEGLIKLAWFIEASGVEELLEEAFGLAPKSSLLAHIKTIINLPEN